LFAACRLLIFETSIVASILHYLPIKMGTRAVFRNDITFSKLNRWDFDTASDSHNTFKPTMKFLQIISGVVERPRRLCTATQRIGGARDGLAVAM
jgi:hypothetical protein